MRFTSAGATPQSSPGTLSVCSPSMGGRVMLANQRRQRRIACELGPAAARTLGRDGDLRGVAVTSFEGGAAKAQKGLRKN